MNTSIFRTFIFRELRPQKREITVEIKIKKKQLRSEAWLGIF